MNNFGSNGDQQEEIDFEIEIAEFISGNLIKKCEVLEKQQGSAKMLIKTLEDLDITIVCSTTKGIEVKIAKFFKYAGGIL